MTPNMDIDNIACAPPDPPHPHTLDPRDNPNASIPPINRIAILGGGPSGVATLARLIKFRPKYFNNIDLFEQREDVGGIWEYTGKEAVRGLVDFCEGGGEGQGENGRVYLPLDSPVHGNAVEVDRPVVVRRKKVVKEEKENEKDKENEEDIEKKIIFPSAIYPSLTANLPTPIMQFVDYPFPEGTELFPRHEQILEYVRGYFGKLKLEGVKVVRRGEGKGKREEKDGEGAGGVTAWFGKKVRRVEKVEGRGWRVVVKDVGEGDVYGSGFGGGGEEKGERDKQEGGQERGEDGEERWYDAVVIAGGRYSVPYIPDLPGLKEWVLAGKGKRVIEHSREFREVEERYRGKKILMVGSSVSADDILRLILPMNPSLPIYQSMRLPGTQTNPSILPIPTISHFDPITGDIHLHPFPSSSPTSPPDIQTTLSSIDLILFCTGYLLTAPFLPQTDPSIPHPSPRGTHIPDLLLHSISSQDPTLAWIGLPYRVVPFPLTSAQAAVLARVWAGLLPLEDVREVNERHMKEVYGGEIEGGGSAAAVAGEGGITSLVDPQTWQRVFEEMKSGGREKDAYRHLLTPPRDWMFLEKLGNLCRGCDNRHHGPAEWKKDVYTWSIYIKKVRTKLGQIRERYDSTVAATAITAGGKQKVSTLEEIGFGVKDVMGSDGDGEGVDGASSGGKGGSPGDEDQD